MLRYPDEIKSIIQGVDNAISSDGQAAKLKRKVPIVLLGGAAILLAHGGKRWTEDIDIMHHSSIYPMGNYLGAFHVVSDSIAMLHPDYHERTRLEYELNNIEVRTLAPVDIMIAKTARGLAKDYHDIYASDLTKDISPNEFEALYREGMQYWLGNQADFERNLQNTLELMRVRSAVLSGDLLRVFNENLDRVAKKGMIAGSAEVKVLKLLSAQTSDDVSNYSDDPAICALANYVAANIGESLCDSKEAVHVGEALRRHFRFMSANAIADPKIACFSVAGNVFKLFRTVAEATIKSLPDEDVDRFNISRFPGR